MIKKLLGLAILALFLSPETFAQDPSVRIPEISGAAGSVVVLPVLISPTIDVTALQITVRLPEGLSVVEHPVRRGDVLSDHSFTHLTVGRELTVVVFSTSRSALNPMGGSVVQLVLNVSQQAGNGQRLEVEFIEAVASTTQGNAVVLETSNGVVRVSGVLIPPTEGLNRLFFPQVANGVFGQNRFGFTTILVNLTDAEVLAQVTFVTSSGGPFEITLLNGQSGSSFEVMIPPQGSALLESNGLGGLQAGYAIVDSTAPLGGTLVFAVTDSSNRVLFEAGVGNSSPGKRFTVPVSFVRQTADTGLALANPFATSASIEIILKDASGQILQTIDLDLPGGEHVARFVSVFFSTVIANLQTLDGSLEIISDQPISVIALRQIRGFLLTTLPVIPLDPGA